MARDGKGYIDAKYLENNDVCRGPGKESEEAGVQNDNGNDLTEESNGDGKETQLNGTIQTGEASEVDWSPLMALVTSEGNALTEQVKADEKGSQLKGTIEKALLQKFLVPAEVYAENAPKSLS